MHEGTDRWGRPHVASLSFHSLLNVRRSLESGKFLTVPIFVVNENNHKFPKGVILLDLEEKDLPGIIYRVVEQMVVEELIDEEDKAAVMRLLLLRHKHVQQDSDKFSRFIRRNTASYTSLTVISFFSHTIDFFFYGFRIYYFKNIRIYLKNELFNNFNLIIIK